jgi:hypothetical protein
MSVSIKLTRNASAMIKNSLDEASQEIEQSVSQLIISDKSIIREKSIVAHGNVFFSAILSDFGIIHPLSR